MNSKPIFNNKFLQLAQSLLEKETLNYDEVVSLIGPPAQEAKKRKIEPIEFEDSLNSLTQKD